MKFGIWGDNHDGSDQCLSFFSDKGVDKLIRLDANTGTKGEMASTFMNKYIRLISIDSSSQLSPQLDKIKEEVQSIEWSNSRFKVVICHQPLFAVFENKIISFLRKNGATLFISSAWNMYNRSVKGEATRLIIGGSRGGLHGKWMGRLVPGSIKSISTRHVAIVTVYEPRLEVIVYEVPSGNIIDSINIWRTREVDTNNYF